LCQKIGQRANKEDKERGKFWQARYRAVRLLDETAILACAAYVDLNPIRAALAETIETSPYTSAQQRALELQARTTKARVTTPQSNGELPESPVARPELRPIARSLSPVCLTEDGSGIGPCVHTSGMRASDKGFLPLSTATYLELLRKFGDTQLRGLHVHRPSAFGAKFEPNSGTHNLAVSTCIAGRLSNGPN
jgi:hypothetical protein